MPPPDSDVMAVPSMSSNATRLEEGCESEGEGNLGGGGDVGERGREGGEGSGDEGEGEGGRDGGGRGGSGGKGDGRFGGDGGNCEGGGNGWGALT